MILAIDVYYKESLAKVGGIIFLNQGEEEIIEIIVEETTDFGDYVPGQFYKRELPCIIKILEQIDVTKIELIIIDGYVYTDNDKNYGLGAYVYDYCQKIIPIIGVAKSSFYKNKLTCLKLYRGQSKKPLYISSIGINIDKALEIIKNMKGDYRMPDMLIKVDRITKE